MRLIVPVVTLALLLAACAKSEEESGLNSAPGPVLAYAASDTAQESDAAR